MFYALSKILTFVLQPSSLLWLALVAGLVLRERSQRFRRAGLRLSILALLGLLVGGLSPLSNALVLPLENRFPSLTPASVPRPVAGIILLGGAQDGWVSVGRRTLALNEAAERITETARLALAHPEARIVITGGEGRLIGKSVEGTTAVAEFLRELGVAPGRLILETRSRNTHENATLTLPLIEPKPRPGETWLLVTSAYHMPRSVGVFRKAGLDVTAYPVDHRTHGPEDMTRWFDGLAAGFMRLDMVAKEWAGLFFYWLTGRTSALFPAP